MFRFRDIERQDQAVAGIRSCELLQRFLRSCCKDDAKAGRKGGLGRARPIPLEQPVVNQTEGLIMILPS